MSNVKHKCRVVRRIKAPNNGKNWSKGSPLRDDSLPKSGNFCHLGSGFRPDWCEILLSQADPCAKFHMNWHNESPLRGENAEMPPVSKFNTSCSFPLHGILPVTREQHDITERRPYYSTVHTGHLIWPITKTL